METEYIGICNKIHGLEKLRAKFLKKYHLVRI